MTEEDMVNGWWDVKPREEWTCPECGVASPVRDWAEVEAPCDLHGSHDGRVCPNCREVFDHVYDSGKIEEASARKEAEKPSETGGESS